MDWEATLTEKEFEELLKSSTSGPEGVANVLAGLIGRRVKVRVNEYSADGSGTDSDGIKECSDPDCPVTDIQKVARDHGLHRASDDAILIASVIYKSMIEINRSMIEIDKSLVAGLSMLSQGLKLSPEDLMAEEDDDDDDDE